MKKALMPVLVVVFSILLGMTYYYYNQFHLLKNQVLRSEYQNRFYINQSIVDSTSFISKDGKDYISFDALVENIDSDIYISKSKSRVYVPVESIVVDTGVDDVDQFIIGNMESINLPLDDIEGRKYLSIDVLKRVIPLEFKTYNSSGIKYLITGKSSFKQIQINQKTSGSINVGIDKVKISSIPAGYSNIGFIDEDGNVNIVDNNGYMVTVDKSFVKEISDLDFKISISNKASNTDYLKTPFHVSWELLTTYEAADPSRFDDYVGVDVLIPTWFNLNVDGIVLNTASLDYVEAAHNSGRAVWGLYKNNFDPDWTTSLLKNEDYMNNSIAQILYYSSIYGLDGINIDFENIYLEDKDGLTAYVKKLGDLLKVANLTSSMDVTVPWGSDMWSKVYDRVPLSNSVDFMMLMAYDEYWASSPEAGSVASRDWTEKGISQSLELISRDKLILGMPLYTRVWSKSPESSRYKSKDLTLKKLEEYIVNNNISSWYDETSGQNYSEYTEGGVLYKIWHEDNTSIMMRLNLAKKYDLPGIATWSVRFGDKEHFNFIDNNIE